MRKLLVAVVAAALTMGAMAAQSITAEVFINIPGEKAVHVMAAKVTFLDYGIVSLATPWGVTYTTHLANVVIVSRKNGVAQ